MKNLSSNLDVSLRPDLIVIKWTPVSCPTQPARPQRWQLPHPAVLSARQTPPDAPASAVNPHRCAGKPDPGIILPHGFSPSPPRFCPPAVRMNPATARSFCALIPSCRSGAPRSPSAASFHPLRRVAPSHGGTVFSSSRADKSPRRAAFFLCNSLKTKP